MVHNTSTDRFRGEKIDYSLVGVIPPYAPLQRKRHIVSGKKIVVVAGDVGGLNAILPVLPFLKQAKHAVRFYLVGPCEKKYLAGDLPFPDGIEIAHGGFTREAIEIMLNASLYNLLIVCASQGDEGAAAGIHATQLAFNANLPIMGIEDMYASMGPILEKTAFFMDRICVMDEVAQQLLATRYTNCKSNIVVTGGPQFDNLIPMKKQYKTLRASLRNAMGAKDNDLVFLIAGGINGTADLLEITTQGISQAEVRDRSKIILRSHGRATTEDKELMKAWLDGHPEQQFVDPGKTLAPSSDDILPGADFVLTGFGTTGHKGILLEKQGVVFVGTPAFQKDLMAEKTLEKPPQVEDGAAWYVKTGEELADVIRTFLQPTSPRQVLDMIRKQNKIAAYNTGNAALRVFETIEELFP